jgi:hypothetical protein
MSSIPEARPITLTQEERAELEGLARSTKRQTEHRMRQRARIVLMAADGVPSARDRSHGRLHDRYGLETAGALRRSGLRVSTRRVIAAGAGAGLPEAAERPGPDRP